MPFACRRCVTRCSRSSKASVHGTSGAKQVACLRPLRLPFCARLTIDFGNEKDEDQQSRHNVAPTDHVAVLVFALWTLS